MLLKYKPDFEETARRFDAFWARDVLDRPCVAVTAPQADVDARVPVGYRAGCDGSYLGALERFEVWAEQTFFGGESVPSFDISLGPDQFAAFLGAELSDAPEGETNWVQPCLSSLEEARLVLDGQNAAWRKMLEYYRVGAEFSQGKFLLNVPDLHSNMDCLSAMRGPQNLCMDLLTAPGHVARLMEEVRGLYQPVYEAVFAAGDMHTRGTISWAPAYCRGRFAVIECDFLCMISPEDGRKYVMPALEEEADFLDHCVMHLDGAGALRHLDDLLAIKKIDVIQWVPGAGQPITVEWMSVLNRIQDAGKGLWIYDCGPDEIKQYHRQLDPAGLLYSLQVPTRRDAEDLLAWLARNT